MSEVEIRMTALWLRHLRPQGGYEGWLDSQWVIE